MPSTACDQCYRRKTGCAGERPVCTRCTVAALTCTYSTGRPVGKPKGHRKSKSCNATISQSASPDQRSSPLPSMHAADPGPSVKHNHATVHTGSYGGITESPLASLIGAALAPQHCSGLPSTSPNDDQLFNISPSNTSQPSRSTASPYEQSLSHAGPGDEGYFTTTDVPQSSWIETAGTPAWPMQTFPAAFPIGSSSGIAEIPAFCAEPIIDQQWLRSVTVGPSAPAMAMHGTSSPMPCQCSMLLDDMGSLFRCQVSLPRMNFDQVIQVIQRAVENGQTSLQCYVCPTHGRQGVHTNVVVMLQQAVICLQGILRTIGSNVFSASQFGCARGTEVNGYHQHPMESQREVFHALTERELDSMQNLARAVRAMVHIEPVSEDSLAGMMSLLTALDESLEALRRRITMLAQT